jgi:TRAP-type C4-dicarboxylate transport system permease small subunit
MSGALPSEAPEVRPPRGPEAWLFYVGAAALLFAMGADASAVLGRHLGVPLLGSIELVQAGILLAASASMVSATLAERHAVVHLLINRLSPEARTALQWVHSAICCLFFGALAAGSIWIAFDLRGGHEESELLRIPFAPLRIVSILALLGLMLIYARRICKGPVGR